MVKKSRTIYTLGSIIIGLAAIFLVYFLLMVTGVIMVKNENLIITSGSTEAIYNGQEITCEKIEIIDGELSNGHKIVATFSGKLTNVGVTDNSYDYKIVDSQGVDVTSNYIVKKLEGKITVNKRQIKIRATDTTKEYDGKPLTATSAGYSITGGELVEGHKMEVSSSGEITNAGSVDNEIRYTIYDSNGNDVTQNYDVVVTPGKLTVTPMTITVTSADAKKTYDGEPLIKDECKITTGELLDYDGDHVPDHKLVTKTTGSIVAPGEDKNYFEYSIYDIHTNEDVTDNYDVKQVFGTLTVLSSDLIFIGQTFEKEYDGEECPVEKFEVKPTAETIKVIEEYNYTYDIEIDPVTETKAGTHKITFSVTVYDETGKDITDYCNLEEIPGELNILKKQVIIETKSDQVAYSGEPYYGDTVEYEDVIISGNKIKLNKFEDTIVLVEYHKDFIDANSYENMVIVDIVNSSGVSTLTNYQVVHRNGNIKILAKEITINTPEVKVPYDGSFPELDVTQYTADGLLDGHVAEYKATTYTVEDYITAKENSRNILNKPSEVIIKDASGKDVTSNYKISDRGYKTVTLTKVPVKVASMSDVKTYDGKEFISQKLEFTYGEDVTPKEITDGSGKVDIDFFDGHTIKIEFTERDPFINAGSIKNEFTQVIYDSNGLDVTSLFNITKVMGILTINPRYVLITTKNVEKEYTGELQSGKDKGIMVDVGNSIKVINSSAPHILGTNSSIDLGNGNSIVFSDTWTEISVGYIINRPLSYVIAK